jgi:hypothetical protein
MFLLTGDDLTLRIVGCGDGPASFNAEATRRGARVVNNDSPIRDATAFLVFFVVAFSRRHDEHDEARGYFAAEHLRGRRDSSWRRDRSKTDPL